MSKTILIIGVSIFLGISIYSCENCDDCGPLQKEPAVTLKFINQDSLNLIQDSLFILATTIEEINISLLSINAELELYSDSLQTIDLAIAGGDDTIDDLRDRLQLKSDSLQTTFTEFQNLRLEKEDETNQLKTIESTINSGKIRVDSLISITNESMIYVGTDSLERFRFPLSVNLDSTVYGIIIAGETYNLALQYERNFNEDEKSRIEVVVSKIRIINHNFKEVINSCEVCISNETSITVFF